MVSYLGNIFICVYVLKLDSLIIFFMILVSDLTMVLRESIKEPFIRSRLPSFCFTINLPILKNQTLLSHIILDTIVQPNLSFETEMGGSLLIIFR